MLSLNQPISLNDILKRKEWITQKTARRILLGPGTLCTILPKLTQEGVIREIGAEGRRSYQLTEKGRQLYDAECARLRRCVQDLDSEDHL